MPRGRKKTAPDLKVHSPVMEEAESAPEAAPSSPPEEPTEEKKTLIGVHVLPAKRDEIDQRYKALTLDSRTSYLRWLIDTDLEHADAKAPPVVPKPEAVPVVPPAAPVKAVAELAPVIPAVPPPPPTPIAPKRTWADLAALAAWFVVHPVSRMDVDGVTRKYVSKPGPLTTTDHRVALRQAFSNAFAVVRDRLATFRKNFVTALKEAF